MSSFNVFGGSLIQPAFTSYLPINLNSNITLAWPTDFGNNQYLVADRIDVYAQGNGYSITMPNTTNVSVGFGFSIRNASQYTFTLLSNDGVTPISVIGPGIFSSFYLTDNTTQNGSWVLVPSFGNPSVISIGMNTVGEASNNIDITSNTTNPITLSGTFSVGLKGDLAALAGFSGFTGIPTKIGESTWALRALQGTQNQIVVNNANGVSGNPIIQLASAISGINSIALTAGGLNIGVQPNSIASTNVDGGVSLIANGAGNVSLIAGSSGNIIFSASGGNVACDTDFVLGNQGGLVFTDGAGRSLGFVAPATVPISYNVQFPGSLPTATNQCMAVSTISGNSIFLSWVSVPGSSGSSVAGSIPYYTNASGGQGSTTIVATGDDGTPSHRPTGININGVLQAGSVLLNFESNSIGTTTGDLILAPSSPYGVLVNSDLTIRSGKQLKINNTSNTFYYSILAPDLTNDLAVFLPLTSGSANGVLVTDGGNPANLSWSNTLSNLTSISFGVDNIIISDNFIRTITNVKTLRIGTNGIAAITVDNAQVVSMSALSSNSVTVVNTLISPNISAPSGNLSIGAPGSIFLNSSAYVRSGNAIYFNNASNTYSYSLSAQNLTTNYDARLPLNNGSSGGVLTTDGNNPAILTWSNALSNITTASFGTDNIVISGNFIRTITNVNSLRIGTNGIAAITVDNAQAVSIANGLSATSLSATTITASTSVSAPSLLASSGALSLSGPSGIFFASDVYVRSGDNLHFNNSANTFSYSFSAPVLTSSYSSVLPLNNGASGDLLTTDGGNPANLSWTGTLNNLTSASFGTNNIVISGSSIRTTTNVNSLTIGTNNATAITINSSQAASFTNGASFGGPVTCTRLVTAPALGSTAATFTLATNYTNTLPYDILLTVYLDFAGAATITTNVNPTAITTGQTVVVARASSLAVPLYVPSGYTCYIAKTAGAPAVNVIGTMICPI